MSSDSFFIFYFFFILLFDAWYMPISFAQGQGRLKLRIWYQKFTNRSWVQNGDDGLCSWWEQTNSIFGTSSHGDLFTRFLTKNIQRKMVAWKLLRKISPHSGKENNNDNNRQLSRPHFEAEGTERSWTKRDSTLKSMVNTMS